MGSLQYGKCGAHDTSLWADEQVGAFEWDR